MASYEAESLRRQFELADNELRLSDEDQWQFDKNERYEQLMRPFQPYIGKILCEDRMHYYETDPRSSLEGSTIRALVAPYHHLFKHDQAWQAARTVPMVRLIFAREVSPTSTARGLLTCNDFIIDARAKSMSWYSRHLSLDYKDGKPLLSSAEIRMADVPCLFNATGQSGQEGGAKLAARPILYLSAEYENQLIQTDFQPGAARELTDYAYVLGDSYELPIHRKQVYRRR